MGRMPGLTGRRQKEVTLGAGCEASLEKAHLDKLQVEFPVSSGFKTPSPAPGFEAIKERK